MCSFIIVTKRRQSGITLLFKVFVLGKYSQKGKKHKNSRGCNTGSCSMQHPGWVLCTLLSIYSVLTLPLLPESAGLAGPAVGRAVAAGARVVAAGALVDVAPGAAPRGRLLLAVAAPVVEVGVTLTQRRACNKVRVYDRAGSHEGLLCANQTHPLWSLCQRPDFMSLMCPFSIVS